MKKIYKYHLDDFMGPGLYSKELPKGYKVLKVDTQYGLITAWCIVDVDEQKREKLDIAVIGTGFEVPDEMLKKYEFSNTVFAEPYVWHVFIKK